MLVWQVGVFWGSLVFHIWKTFPSTSRTFRCWFQSRLNKARRIGASSSKSKRVQRTDRFYFSCTTYKRKRFSGLGILPYGMLAFFFTTNSCKFYKLSLGLLWMWGRDECWGHRVVVLLRAPNNVWMRGFHKTKLMEIYLNLAQKSSFEIKDEDIIEWIEIDSNSNTCFLFDSSDKEVKFFHRKNTLGSAQ